MLIVENQLDCKVNIMLILKVIEELSQRTQEFSFLLIHLERSIVKSCGEGPKTCLGPSPVRVLVARG